MLEDVDCNRKFTKFGLSPLEKKLILLYNEM